MGSPRLALVGAFVAGGLLLFAVGLFMIGDRRLLFAEHFEVEADFGNVTGVQIGTSVRLSGLPAGEVIGITVPRAPGGRFLVRMRVREDLHSLVRTDSVAAVLTDGLLGAVFIQIRAGTESAPEVADGGALAGADAVEVADLIEEGRETFRLVGAEFVTLREQMSETFDGLGETVAATTRLIENVGGDVGEVTGASALFMEAARDVMTDARGVLADVADGEGTAGKFLTDDALYTHVAGLARETEATMQAVRGSAERFEELVGGLQAPDSATQRMLVDAGDVVTYARDAMADLAENTEAMKRNWLFRGFFSERGFYNLDEMTTDEYRELLADDRYTPLRIWLDADVLFETAAGAAPGATAADAAARLMLGPDAGSRIEEAMGELLQYPRNSPLVVEGYATAGGPGQQFLEASARAALVQDYLTRAFGRAAEVTGTMPLGADAPESPSGDGRWDGVALTLFAETERLEREGVGSAEP